MSLARVCAFAAMLFVPCWIAVPASAQQVIERYFARLGVTDHYNSNGQRLTTPAAILRQDRANFHRFGRRDPEDTGDRFFSLAENRARLENMLDAAETSPGVYNAIVNGTPVVEVEILRLPNGNHAVRVRLP